MSQVRQRKIKRQQQTVKLRETRETVIAAVVAGAVVVGTMLAVWLMRPGGLADRQPRATWWVLISLAIAGVWVWLAYHPAYEFVTPSKRKVFTIGFLAIGVVVLLLGFFWPGGLLRHSSGTPSTGEPIIQAPQSTPSLPAPDSSSTTVADTSTAPGSSPSSGASTMTSGG